MNELYYLFKEENKTTGQLFCVPMCIEKLYYWDTECKTFTGLTAQVLLMKTDLNGPRSSVHISQKTQWLMSTSDWVLPALSTTMYFCYPQLSFVGTICQLLFFPNMFWQFSSVQSLSRVQLFVTPWIAARQASLSINNSRSSLRLTCIEPSSHPAISSSVVPFSSCPQPLPALSLIQWVSSLYEVAKVLEFQF